MWFALELFKKLAAAGGNVTVSPISVALALAMTQEGAVGPTKQQMAQVLHLEADAAASPKLAKELATAFSDGDTVSIANAIWPAKGEAVHPEYVTRVKAYDAGYTELDYRADTEGARATINRWVSDKTAGKIPELLVKDDVKPDTPMVITNAVYLKAKWQQPFKKRGTHDRTFLVLGGETAQVPIMHQKGTFPAADLPDAKVLELPYAGERLALTVVLPKAGLAALEASLTPAVVEGWLAALKPQEALVGLPKLKLRCREKLRAPLEALGMKLPFQDEADFSAMRPPPPPLKIGEVIHQTTMDVDEEGTEASAATAVLMTLGAAAGPPPKLFEFIVDKPFLAFMRDRRTGAILFVTRVADPRKD